MLSTSDYLERLAKPIYLIALMLVLTPLADFIGSVWPLQFGEMRWRFASFALLAGFLFTPLIGSLIAAMLAAVMEERMVLRVIGVLNVVAAAGLFLLLATFAFDALQLRRAVPPDLQGQFRASAIRGCLKLISAIVTSGWLGLAAVKLSRTMTSVAAARAKPRMTGPIVGSR